MDRSPLEQRQRGLAGRLSRDLLGQLLGDQPAPEEREGGSEQVPCAEEEAAVLPPAPVWVKEWINTPDCARSRAYLLGASGQLPGELLRPLDGLRPALAFLPEGCQGGQAALTPEGRFVRGYLLRKLRDPGLPPGHPQTIAPPPQAVNEILAQAGLQTLDDPAWPGTGAWTPDLVLAEPRTGRPLPVRVVAAAGMEPLRDRRTWLAQHEAGRGEIYVVCDTPATQQRAVGEINRALLRVPAVTCLTNLEALRQGQRGPDGSAWLACRCTLRGAQGPG